MHKKISDKISYFAEKLVDRRLKHKSYFESKIKATEDRLYNDRWYPESHQILIDHVDKVIDIAKTFLVVSATVFLGSFAVKEELIINFDLYTFKLLSFAIMLVSVGGILGALHLRQRSVERLINWYSERSELSIEVAKIKDRVSEIANPQDSEEIASSLVGSERK